MISLCVTEMQSSLAISSLMNDSVSADEDYVHNTIDTNRIISYRSQRV